MIYGSPGFPPNSCLQSSQQKKGPRLPVKRSASKVPEKGWRPSNLPVSFCEQTPGCSKGVKAWLVVLCVSCFGRSCVFCLFVFVFALLVRMFAFLLFAISSSLIAFSSHRKAPGPNKPRRGLFLRPAFMRVASLFVASLRCCESLEPRAWMHGSRILRRPRREGLEELEWGNCS